MPSTVAADVDALSRFRADSAALLPSLHAESGALGDALASLASAPSHADPPVPPPPPDLIARLDDLGAEARALTAAVGEAEHRFALADAPRTIVRAAGRGVGIAAGGTTWLEVDLWQAAQSAVALFRIIAPGLPLSAQLTRLLPALRGLLVAGGRTKVVLPIAGSVASAAFTLADVSTFLHDGNPIAAFRRDGAGYVAHGAQVGADVLTEACAAAPSAPACAAALVANLGVIELHDWHDHDLVEVPLLPGAPVPIRPSWAKRTVDEAIGQLGHLTQRGEDALGRVAGPTLREARDLFHDVIPLPLR